MSDHPTDFLLDRYALGEALPEVEAHSNSCERCAARIAEVRAPPGPIPVAILRRTQAPPRRRRWGSVAGALALAAAALLAIWVAQPDPIRPKGAPSVTVWAQTPEGTGPWSGEPLAAGDRVRLWVEPGEHQQIAVRSGERVLYEGELPGPGPLPVSWTLDDDDDDALLDVRLSGGGEEIRVRIAIPRERP